MNFIAELLHITVYRWFIFPVMLFVGWILSYYSEKIAFGFKLRKQNNGLHPWERMKIENPIWVHVSSGEIEYAKPLLRWVKSHYPSEKILVTYFSPSVKPALDMIEEIDQAIPSPWDHPYFLNTFFSQIKPKVLLISRTDFWPEMIYQSKKRGIPRLLFSATFSSQSSRILNPFHRMHFRWIISLFSKIYCVEEMDRVNFEQLGAGVECEVLGDTRYDQVIERLSKPKALNDSLKPASEELIFVAGSTWEDDEKQILKSFSTLIENKIRIIIAPHEPKAAHLNHLESALTSLRLDSIRYSEAQKWDAHQILIVDQVGILADLYQWGAFAFVGNSFRTNAVHSVMEPLAAGCVTFVGPKHHNNREALAFKKLQSKFVSTSMVVEIQNGEALAQHILSLISSPNFLSLHSEIKENIGRRAGVTENLGQVLEGLSVLG